MNLHLYSFCFHSPGISCLVQCILHHLNQHNMHQESTYHMHHNNMHHKNMHHNNMHHNNMHHNNMHHKNMQLQDRVRVMHHKICITKVRVKHHKHTSLEYVSCFTAICLTRVRVMNHKIINHRSLHTYHKYKNVII